MAVWPLTPALKEIRIARRWVHVGTGTDIKKAASQRPEPNILGWSENLATIALLVYTPSVKSEIASCGVEGVIITDDLDRRPSRAADYEAESQAFAAVARSMSSDPATVLQRLVETIIKLTRCGSAGISLLEPEGEQDTFCWVATAGALAPYRNGRIPRAESPCGVVIARNAVLLMADPARAFPALRRATPVIGEGLLAPFNINGVPGGTVWAIMHDQERQFDAEDARLMESLAQFASITYQMVMSQVAAKEQIRSLQNDLIHLLRDSAMASMAATIAHEVNQPLSTAITYVGGVRALIRGGAAPETLVEGINGVEQALLHAGDIIRRLRETARGRQPSIESVRSSNLVRDSIKFLSDVCSGTELQLRLDEDAFVFCDAIQIEQVLMNLIRNACEAVQGRAAPMVTVRTISDLDELRFEIEDTGPGFDPERGASLFDAVSSTKPGGMGIGLAISRTILEAHGSSLMAESLQPVGARFSFRLPKCPIGLDAPQGSGE